jgi:MFS family permease
MRRYLAALRRRDFGLLWFGAAASILGDGMTLVALVWLMLERTGSALDVGWLTFAYAAPVVVGGLGAGVLLDRFDPRAVMAVDSLGRGLLMASVPVLELLGGVPTWWLFVVAAGYGLLKMVPLAGVPALIPRLLDDDDLTTGNALESISYGVAGIAGPALAGVLIAAIGAPAVIGLDAATYFFFLACLLLMRRPPALVRAQGERPASGERAVRGLGLVAAGRVVIASPAIVATTLMFMAANVGEGIFAVVMPVYALEALGGTAAEYGAILAVFSVGILAGSIVVGALATPVRLGRAIAAAQAVAGVVLLGYLARPDLLPSLAIAGVFGLAGSPLTIWAQTLRMRIIPPELRGRVFAILRTLMQSTAPVGGIVAGVLVSGAGIEAAIVAATVVTTVPGLLGLVVPALGLAGGGGGDGAGPAQEALVATEALQRV